jgi:hypothetical protein
MHEAAADVATKAGCGANGVILLLILNAMDVCF